MKYLGGTPVNSIITRCGVPRINNGWEHPIVGPRFNLSNYNKVLKLKRGIDNKSIPLPCTYYLIILFF